MNESYEYEDRGRGSERWGGRTWTLIGALIVVLMIAGAAVWLVTRDDGNGEDTAPTTTVGATAAPTTAAPGSLPPVEQLPEGFVGGREVVGGIPVGFPHDQAGAISAGAVWTSYMFICPPDQRPIEGLAHIMSADAPPLTPCGGGETDPSVSGQTPLAVRGSVSGDSGVLEYLTVGSHDFLTDLGWQVTSHVVTLTLMWSPDADDWSVTTWSRRNLFDSEAAEITPELFAGFQWLRPVGAALTATPFVAGA